MNLSRIILGVIAAAVIAAGFSLPASGQDSQDAQSSPGSVQGYSASEPIDSGRIVQLSKDNSSRVELASQENLQNMFGVTVHRNQLPMTLSSEELDNEVFVAVSGTYNVLVSSQAGPISSGDYVTMSSVNGVAMKAGTEEETVFGRSAGSFDGSGVTLGTAVLEDDAGGKETVKLGLIPVTINVQSNPNEKSTEANVPDFLKRVGQEIAEKEVSPIRIYLSTAITAISLIAAIIVLYSGVKNGVISIGRNPMSKKSIFRALLEIILTSLAILIIGLFAVYLLLRL